MKKINLDLQTIKINEKLLMTRTLELEIDTMPLGGCFENR